jgi:hypothetical protein
MNSFAVAPAAEASSNGGRRSRKSERLPNMSESMFFSPKRTGTDRLER